MSRQIFVLLLLALLNVSCSDDSRPDPDPQNCGTACATLQRLGCPEGNDIFIPDQSEDAGPEAGTSMTCTAWCEDVQKKGHALNASCVSKINSCAELSNCDW